MNGLVNMKWQPNENHGKPCDKCGSTKDVRECRVVVRNYRRLKKPQFEYECLECMKWRKLDFYKYKNNIDGLGSKCRVCERQYAEDREGMRGMSDQL